MRKFTLLYFLFFAAGISKAQINKGQFLLGGNVNFEATKNENSINPTYETNNFFVAPNIGYFIVDKLAGGLRIDFRSYDSESENLETHYTTTSLSPFLRYYFLPLQKNVNVFIDISYIRNKTKWNSNANPDYFERSRGYTISAGPSIFLSDQIALEFTLGYKHTKSDNFGNTKVNIFNSGFGLQFHFGKIKYKSKNSDNNP